MYILFTAVFTALTYPRGRLVNKNLVQKAANPTGSLAGSLLCPPSLVTGRIAGDFSWAFHVELNIILLRYAILYKEITSCWSFLSSAPFECGWIIPALSSAPVIYINNRRLNNYIKQWHKCYFNALHWSIRHVHLVAQQHIQEGWICRSQWAITRPTTPVPVNTAVSIGVWGDAIANPQQEARSPQSTRC